MLLLNWRTPGKARFISFSVLLLTHKGIFSLECFLESLSVLEMAPEVNQGMSGRVFAATRLFQAWPGSAQLGLYGHIHWVPGALLWGGWRYSSLTSFTNPLSTAGSGCCRIAKSWLYRLSQPIVLVTMTLSHRTMCKGIYKQKVLL